MDQPACCVLLHAHSLRSNPAFLPPIIQIPTESQHQTVEHPRGERWRGGRGKPGFSLSTVLAHPIKMPHCFCCEDLFFLLPLEHIVALVVGHTVSQQERDAAWRKMGFELVQNTQPWYPADARLDIPTREEQKQRTPMNHLLHEGPLAVQTSRTAGTLSIFLVCAAFGGTALGEHSFLVFSGKKWQLQQTDVECS